MNINATLINLYHVCQRECWLHTNGINMEHTSDTVYDGKLLHETSYPQRAEKYTEIELSAVLNDEIILTGKIDFYDAKEKIIHETKRSDKIEEAHEWQVKYYIWLLELNGIEDVEAILEYPTLRHKNLVKLSEADKQHLLSIIRNIAQLKVSDNCPPKINAKICKSCSYYELCYIDE
ncbi:CRISPR-associated protein Cas4 [Arachidicoccus soli]|uniref:CRISPR-associated exonuclease Cas4 n=1 Tax=Arachidicoccus soli TaxID=2341117 RepID=A0A386HSM8_9BACT|nr:CRISPR-associated protein Cas4 [Arachidicoccus soli]AYD48410.1 CRISPR-associated protein Cas4 [Arachidicoccus soli]